MKINAFIGSNWFNYIDWLISVDSLMSTSLTRWFDLFNHYPQEQKHLGRNDIIRAQNLQTLWDSLHILTHVSIVLNKVWLVIEHGTIIWTGKTRRKFLYKSLLNSAWLWSRAGLAINKKHISRYQTTNFLKTLFLFLICKKGQKEDKSEFVTKSEEIIVTIIFIQKYLSKY